MLPTTKKKDPKVYESIDRQKAEVPIVDEEKEDEEDEDGFNEPNVALYCNRSQLRRSAFVLLIGLLAVMMLCLVGFFIGFLDLRGKKCCECPPSVSMCCCEHLRDAANNILNKLEEAEGSGISGTDMCDTMLIILPEFVDSKQNTDKCKDRMKKMLFLNSKCNITRTMGRKITQNSTCCFDVVSDTSDETTNE